MCRGPNRYKDICSLRGNKDFRLVCTFTKDESVGMKWKEETEAVQNYIFVGNDASFSKMLFIDKI